MICKESARICKEWAKDFKQNGDTEMEGFWRSIGAAFFKGMQIQGEGLDFAIEELKKQIAIHDDALKIVADPRVKAGIEEIHKEQLFMLPKLEELAKENAY